MRTLLLAFAAVALLGASVVVASARTDIRVQTDKDKKGNITYTLTNLGDKKVKATVEFKKTCRSTTTLKEPIEREYWLRPKRSAKLRRVMANSDCRHTFRILNAEYY